MSERELPHSYDAEVGAVGAMLFDPMRLVPVALNKLGMPREAFHDHRHRAIVGAMYEMIVEDPTGIDILTVTQKLRVRNELDQIGGASYLETLIDGTPTPAHGEHYLDIVRDRYIARKIIERTKIVLNDAYVCERADELMKKIPQQYVDIMSDVIREVPNSEVLDEVYSEWVAAKAGDLSALGLSTGWPRLDEVTGGLSTGMYIVAANPSQGKTTVEDNISVHIASQGIPVARVQIDMKAKDVWPRSVCRKAGVSLNKLRAGHAREDQMARVREVMDVLKTYPIYNNDYDQDIQAICTWARGMKLRHNIKLLTLDFIQVATVSTPRGGYLDENARITMASGMLKRLSLDLDIPVLILSQLSRANAKDNRPPQLSDLRGSGSLEQDAKVVIFTYKDQKIPDENNKTPQWIDVAKQQNGELKAIPYWWKRPYFQFEAAPDYFGEVPETVGA
ncbi:MAG: replicative DNA helicase [Deltaproteobacteria bacterium]|nr:replicative DNA helicase [Deltaproteobacteria bacterium]